MNALRSAEVAPNVIERLQRQLIQHDAGLLDYLETARRLGHGVTITLYILPNGRLGNPKLGIDTRGDTR